MDKIIEFSNSASGRKESEFDSVVLVSPIPVFVDFWSPGCVPCRAMAPIIDAIAEEYDGRIKFVKVNLYECMTLAARFNVSSLPTILMFDKGVMSEKISSALGKDKIKTLLEKFL